MTFPGAKPTRGVGGLNLARAGGFKTYKATGRVDHLSSLVPSCGAFCNTEAITRGFGWGE